MHAVTEGHLRNARFTHTTQGLAGLLQRRVRVVEILGRGDDRVPLVLRLRHDFFEDRFEVRGIAVEGGPEELDADVVFVGPHRPHELEARLVGELVVFRHRALDLDIALAFHAARQVGEAVGQAGAAIHRVHHDARHDGHVRVDPLHPILVGHFVVLAGRLEPRQNDVTLLQQQLRRGHDQHADQLVAELQGEVVTAGGKAARLLVVEILQRAPILDRPALHGHVVQQRELRRGVSNSLRLPCELLVDVERAQR